MSIRLSTHCRRGHEYTLENTAYEKNNRGAFVRRCKDCHRLRTAQARRMIKDLPEYTPRPRYANAMRRFADKVIIRPNGCWEWTASTDSNYGTFRFEGKNRRAHLFVMEHLGLYEPSNDGGHDNHHLCENRLCVNPSHISVIPESLHIKVTFQGYLGNRRRQNTCCRGHLLEGANLYMNSHANGQKYRVCRACQCEAQRRYRARKASIAQ